MGEFSVPTYISTLVIQEHIINSHTGQLFAMATQGINTCKLCSLPEIITKWLEAYLVAGSLGFDGLGVHAWEMPIERYNLFTLVSA